METSPAARPDFIVIGAPKAGSTALHDALALHPQLHASAVKEPKFFMTGGRRPPRSTQQGPGDAHSAREWVWRRADYEALFSAAPAGSLRFESTPFYLWDRTSHARIAAELPEVKLIAVIRDPVDRAFSNWMHLWADGLEPKADFLAACRDEERRIAAGYAPFWRYLETGKYGEQLVSLFEHVDPARIRVIRYRELVDTPREALDSLCTFLGVDTGVLSGLPDSNLGRWAPESRANTLLRWGVRGGAAAGSYVDPKVWRAVEKPLLGVLQRGGHKRPKLDPEVRAELIEEFRADNQVLNRLLNVDYSDWLSPVGRGTYTVRRS